MDIGVSYLGTEDIWEACVIPVLLQLAKLTILTGQLRLGSLSAVVIPLHHRMFQCSSLDYIETTSMHATSALEGTQDSGQPCESWIGSEPICGLWVTTAPCPTRPGGAWTSGVGPAPGRGEAGAMQLPTLRLGRPQPSLPLETISGWASKEAELVAMKRRGLLPRTSYCPTCTGYCISRTSLNPACPLWKHKPVHVLLHTTRRTETLVGRYLLRFSWNDKDFWVMRVSYDQISSFSPLNSWRLFLNNYTVI